MRRTNPRLRGLPPCGARNELLNQHHLAKIDAKARFKCFSFRKFLNTPGWSHWGKQLMPISYRIGRRRIERPAHIRAICYRDCVF